MVNQLRYTEQSSADQGGLDFWTFDGFWSDLGGSFVIVILTREGRITALEM